MIWVLICLLVTTDVQAQSPPESVLKLNDDTFEHTTQASTGQTTGNWLILFSEPSHASHKELVKIWGSLSDYATTERLGVLLAQVDISAAPVTKHRFGIGSEPDAVLLSNQKMYRVPGPLRGPGSQKRLQEFMETGASQVPGSKVPSASENLWKVFTQDFLGEEGWKPAVFALVGLGGGVMFLVLFARQLRTETQRYKRD